MNLMRKKMLQVNIIFLIINCSLLVFNYYYINSKKIEKERKNFPLVLNNQIIEKDEFLEKDKFFKLIKLAYLSFSLSYEEWQNKNIYIKQNINVEKESDFVKKRLDKKFLNKNIFVDEIGYYPSKPILGGGGYILVDRKSGKVILKILTK